MTGSLHRNGINKLHQGDRHHTDIATDRVSENSKHLAKKKYHVVCVICHMPYVMCHMSCILEKLNISTYADSSTNTKKSYIYIFCITCHLSPVTCNLSPVTCNLSSVPCPLTTTLCSFSCNESPQEVW